MKMCSTFLTYVTFYQNVFNLQVIVGWGSWSFPSGSSNNAKIVEFSVTKYRNFCTACSAVINASFFSLGCEMQCLYNVISSSNDEIDCGPHSFGKNPTCSSTSVNIVSAASRTLIETGFNSLSSFNFIGSPGFPTLFEPDIPNSITSKTVVKHSLSCNKYGCLISQHEVHWKAATIVLCKSLLWAGGGREHW